MQIPKIMPKFALAKPQQGSLAEWLGTGLQNRLQQFDSARNLKNDARFGGHCCFIYTAKLQYRRLIAKNII